MDAIGSSGTRLVLPASWIGERATSLGSTSSSRGERATCAQLLTRDCLAGWNGPALRSEVSLDTPVQLPSRTARRALVPQPPHIADSRPLTSHSTARRERTRRVAAGLKMVRPVCLPHPQSRADTRLDPPCTHTPPPHLAPDLVDTGHALARSFEHDRASLSLPSLTKSPASFRGKQRSGYSCSDSTRRA